MIQSIYFSYFKSHMIQLPSVLAVTHCNKTTNTQAIRNSFNLITQAKWRDMVENIESRGVVRDSRRGVVMGSKDCRSVKLWGSGSSQTR